MQNPAKFTMLILGIVCGLVIEATGATTNAMSPGQILAGSITAPLQTNFYTFTANSNDVISTVLLRTNGTGSGYFYLYDPMGNQVYAAAGDGVRAHVPGTRLTKAGSYTLVVIDSSLTFSYDYLLSFSQVAGGVNQREPGDGAEAIVPGQITSGHIGPADMDTFTFT